MGRYWRVFTILSGLFISTFSVAHAQYHEESMEPAEIGIKDIEKLTIPGAAYVGNDVCRQCHEAAYQKWLGTDHSRTYVPMRSMMGMMMGEQQGVTACCPAKSGKCMKCHGTAHDVPAAYRGPGFRMGEGVACEKCHGPGGDHVQALEDPQNGVDGTLGVGGEETCMNCHRPKKSHAKLEREPFNFARGWKRIAHPMSMERAEDEMEPIELGIWRIEEAEVPEASYVGSATCGHCHEETFRRWRQTAHARSFKPLFSEMGYGMDRMGKVVTVGGPAKNGMCLQCHATGHDAPAAQRETGFLMREGVGCEKCHGPGGEHVKGMENHVEIEGMGLKARPDDASCKTCHKRKRSHAMPGKKRFSFPQAWGKIAH
jgi:hypothetical protein